MYQGMMGKWKSCFLYPTKNEGQWENIGCYYTLYNEKYWIMYLLSRLAAGEGRPECRLWFSKPLAGVFIRGNRQDCTRLQGTLTGLESQDWNTLIYMANRDQTWGSCGRLSKRAEVIGRTNKLGAWLVWCHTRGETQGSGRWSRLDLRPVRDR